MMTGDTYSQHDYAIHERHLRIVDRAKKFAKVIQSVHNANIVVEVETSDAGRETFNWIHETIRFVYLRWPEDVDRVTKLYIALAQKFTDANMVISEVDSDGNGTTTHFNTTYPSQVIKI